MNQSDKDMTASVIRDAIREKHQRKSLPAADIEALEASLLADIETFDLDAAERRARQDASANAFAGMVDPAVEYPEIVPAPPPRVSPKTSSNVNVAADEMAPVPFSETGSLLDQLRQQAAIQQHDETLVQSERSAGNKLIDETLKFIFFYLHDLVQQLNILKPAIPRTYSLAEKFELNKLVWQDGFADYRTQAQSVGAMLELVTLTYHLQAPDSLKMERGGEVAERFRTMLFDFGLQFSFKEFKNDRRYVERVEFEIQRQLSVSVRWRADYKRGLLVFESRNFERLGGISFTVRPGAVDFALLEDLSKLILGQPSRFRELAKR
jgi:hypothetical protein